MPIIPTVIEQTPQGERAYDLFSRLLNDRIIILSGVVDDTTAASIVGQMLFLEAQDPDKEIYLYINTYGGQGGDEHAGLSIYDTMMYIKCDVVTICMGMGGCIGALLVAAGAHGKRYALPNTEFLLEQPLYGASGQATNIKIAADPTMGQIIVYTINADGETQVNQNPQTTVNLSVLTGEKIKIVPSANYGYVADFTLGNWIFEKQDNDASAGQFTSSGQNVTFAGFNSNGTILVPFSRELFSVETKLGYVENGVFEQINQDISNYATITYNTSSDGTKQLNGQTLPAYYYEKQGSLSAEITKQGYKLNGWYSSL